MFQVEMTATVRETSGKGAMRRLRMEGMTPAVVYGRGEEALKIQLNAKTLMAKLLEFSRRNTVVTLKIDDQSEKSVMIGEIQTDPVRDTLIHVDFCEIDLEKDRSYNVPVVYKGVAKGVDLGGEMVVNQKHIVLNGKPLDIPDECVVDVSKLAIGAIVRCSEIVIPDTVRMITKPKAIAVAINKPGVKVEEKEAELLVE
jgi:large subunit ribosomal protein L25